MLAITRKEGQTVRLTGGIVVYVVSSGSGKVRLGFEAPANVRILRGELPDAAEPQPVPEPEPEPAPAAVVTPPPAAPLALVYDRVRRSWVAPGKVGAA